MLCEPIKDHVEWQQLSQKPLKDSCQIGIKELTNEILQEPLSCGGQITRSNVSPQLLKKPLEMSSQPLSLHLKNQKYNLDLHSALETECNVSDNRRNVNHMETTSGAWLL